MRFCAAEETRLNKLLELQIAQDVRRENEEEGRRPGATRVVGWNVERGFQIAKNLEGCRKVGREMDFRTEYQFSTELPLTWGSFTASVRDHNLRKASHLFYEGKE